eukprot:3307811-Amphidinium_carterae.1
MQERDLDKLLHANCPRSCPRWHLGKNLDPLFPAAVLFKCFGDVAEDEQNSDADSDDSIVIAGHRLTSCARILLDWMLGAVVGGRHWSNS